MNNIEQLVKHHKAYFSQFEAKYYSNDLYRSTERKYVKWALKQGLNITEMKERIQYQRGVYNVERI